MQMRAGLVVSLDGYCDQHHHSDLCDEDTWMKRSCLADLPATIAVTVLPLSRFRRSLRLICVFKCMNSSMNQDAMSFSFTCVYNGSQYEDDL